MDTDQQKRIARKQQQKNMYVSHNFRAVIVKLIRFSLWTSVAVTHFDERLGLVHVTDF